MLNLIFIGLLVGIAGTMLLFLVIVFYLYFPRKRRGDAAGSLPGLSSGIARLHQVIPHSYRHDRSDNDAQKRIPRIPSERLFSWSDHPSLVTDVVENGWPRFAFTTFVTSHIKSGPSLLGIRGSENKVEVGWEVCDGSSEYMQKIRLNPGLKKIAGCGLNSPTEAASAIRAALPLPGPQLGNSAFPQEAYFEIIIMPDEKNDEKSHRDTMKLIGEDFPRKGVENSGSHGRIEEVIGEEIMMSVGLTRGGHLHLKIPGSYPGSIGFNSTGSVYLDGKKLVPESEDADWGTAEKVIGCGYIPSQKNVYFTVNSQLAHVIHCKNDPFGSPLYPTLAANADITVLVNLGQCPFKFAPANAQRTPNPCFIHPAETSSALSYEDSKELFSMGRIDAQWRQRGRSNTRDLENDQDDLFEISLDISGRIGH